MQIQTSTFATCLFLVFNLWAYSVVGQCTISDLYAEPHTCNDAGLTWIDFEFESEGDISDYFIVAGNGIVYDTFNYGMPFYTIGPLLADCNTLYELIVYDSEFADCADDFGFDEPLCCPIECSYTNFNTTNIQCLDTSLLVTIDFDYTSATHEYFDLWFDGSFANVYAYDSLPIQVEVPLNSFGITDFLVYDNDNDGCNTEFAFVHPYCGEAACGFYNIQWQVWGCEQDSMYVDISFNYGDQHSNTFSVVSGDAIYGTYTYGQSSVTVGPFSNNCNTFYDFQLVDNALNECISDTIYEVIFCCDFDECAISDVTIDGVSCTDNGISFWLDFSIANNTNSTYEVAFNDNYLGTHLIDSLPMYFETGSTDMPNDFLVICETGETGCCFEWEIPGGLCDSGDCQIFDVFAEPYNCNDDGLFMVDIGFEYLNIEGNTFTILGNGNNYGTFEYGEPYYTLGPLEADCSTLLEFVIIDDTIDGCVGVFEFEEPICCSEVDCVISGLELYNIECNTNGNGYHVTLDFEYVGANGEDFVLSINNGVFNQYSYADLPLRLNDLPIPEEATTFLVCQGGLEDCCLDAYIVQPNCGDKACEIFDVIAEAYNCDDNEGFLVDIAFAYQHTQGNTFTILGNGNNYGTYEYGQPYYTIGPLVADCETLYEFVIVDNTMDGCSAATWFEEPICCESNTDCVINAVEAFDEECSGEDGYYHISINFNYSGTSNDFFDMYVNGEFYGFYAFADLPIRLNSIEVTDQTFIVICENDNEECCTELSIDPPSCNDSAGCEIFDVFAEAYDCEDGGFLVGLEFDYSETTSNTFTIVGNGNIYGTFEYGAEYYTIGPLEADCETIFEFVIVDNENEACSGFYVFDEPICCDDCPSEFTTSVDTTINGTLILSITTLPADGFFNLILNGDDFGNFNYGDDISFALDNDTEYAIVLTDIENSDCKYMESLLTTAAPTSTTEPSLLQGEVISRLQSLFFDFPIGSQFATYDCQGRQVMDGSVDSDNYSLQHQLPQGIYFINIWFNNQRSIKKVHLK